MLNDSKSSDSKVMELKLSDFEGPLDLLLHLISRNKIDIYDIPIAEITSQYLAYLDQMKELDLASASEFLLMAASLTQIKSKMLLPTDKIDGDIEDDPRDELVLKLLAYRRCKVIALNLENRFSEYSTCAFKIPETLKSLDIEFEKKEFDLSTLARDKFDEACLDIEKRNAARYQDLREKHAYILRRERYSLKEAVGSLFSHAKKRVHFFFNSFVSRKNKLLTITQFLALLELVKQNLIHVKQEKNFSDIEIELNRENSSDKIDFEDLSDE